MNKIYTLPEDELRGEIYQRMLRLMGKNRGSWQSVAAAVSLFGGLLAIVLGVLDWAVVGLFAPAGALGSFLDTAGTILLVLPLTLLALGAFCLDLLEKKPPALPLPAEPRPAVPLLRHYRRPRRARLVALSGFVLLLSGGLRPAVRAQQTLFNVPSADVLDSGRVYAELDVSFKPVEPKFSSFVPRVVVGVGRRVEIGLNVTGNVQSVADTTTLVPAVKWKPYDGGDNGWAFFVGNNLFIPVRNRPYRVGHYAYAALGKTLGTRTRLTAGGYHFTKDVVAPGAQRAGGQFGFEQPVTDKFTVQADWLTGKHSNGYFTPGAAYKLGPKLTGYLGYSLGNGGLRRGNHFFYAAAGFNFD